MRPSRARRPAVHVAVNLVALRLYVDRFRMLCHLSAEVGRLYLLTDSIDAEFAAEAARWPNLRVITLGQRRFRARAHAWLDAQLAGPGLDVVHDTFGHLADWMQARARDPERRVRFFTTQYTTNYGWFNEVRRRPGLSLDWAYGALRLVTYWRDRRVCRAVDCSIVLGPGHERALVEGHGVPADRVVWLPSEVDTDRFYPTETVEAGAQSQQPPTVLFTGAVIRNKGVDLLLEAVRRLRLTRPTLRLILVGRVPGPERAWLTQTLEAADLGSAVELRAQMPQSALIALYQQADVFVLPSLFEGSPRSLREALACGSRAVASDIPGNRGIDPDGAYIRFAPVGDVAAWVDACAAMLDESQAEAAARRARGVASMRARHSLPAVARAWAGLYERVRRAPPNVI
jgi:glycosyltransferase involved in cell wall biosynthesis